MKKFRNIFNLLSTFMLMMLAVPVNAQDDAKGLIVSFNGPVREAYIGKFVRGQRYGWIKGL